MTALLVRSRLRFAWRNPVADAAALAGVALAVMAVVAVHLVGQSIRAAVDGAAAPEATLGGFTHMATRTALTESDYFALRARWRRGEMTNATALLPVVDGFVTVGGEPRRLLGFDPLAAGYGLSAARSTLSAGGADAGGFLAGDVLMAPPDAADAIADAGGEVAGVPVTVVVAPGAALLLADLPTAQRLLGREGELDAVWLRVSGTRSRLLAWLDGLLPGIAAALPGFADPAVPGFHVAAHGQALRRFADAIVFNMGALAMLTLLMAALLAAQAAFSHAARRRREVERLLVIGVSRQRLRLLAAAEGLALGGGGALLGLGLGVIVADFLVQTAGDGAGAPPVDAWVVAKALFCGALASCVGPLYAGSDARQSGGRWRGVAGPLFVALAMLGVLHGSLAAVFGALFAACLVQILHVVPLVAGAAGRLARAASADRLRRRSNLRAAAARGDEIRLALGALSVAAATAIGMGLMVESLRQDFAAMLDQRLQDGVYLRGGDSDDVHFDADWIRGLPGVVDVRRYGDFDGRADAGPARVSLARLDAWETARYEFAGPLDDGALVNEVGARFLGLAVGDSVAVTGAGGHMDVQVAHVFRDFGAPTARLILPAALRSRFDERRVAWQRLAVLAAPADVPRLTAALAERYGAARVRNQSEIRAAAMAVFDRTFAVSRALTAVALAVAAIGLYAALTSLQASRRREFRLLSALGCSAAEIWRMAMAQATLLGAVAAVAALPLGVAMAWLLCDFVNPLAFGWSIRLRLDAAAIAYPALLGIVAAAAAGAVPAYRSSFRGEA